MAQKVETFYEDDIDGGTADETVTFGLDGRAYEIDLSEKNATKLRKALAPYLSAGRRAGRVVRPSGIRSSLAATGPGDAAAMRAWALENGHEVSARGRVPAYIREAYQSAH
jgi:hypothetical protein